MFRNILVAIDGSTHSDRALGEAIDLATANHGRLTLLAAVPRPPAWVATPAAAATMQSLAQDLEQEAKDTLAAAVERVPVAIPVTKILSHDPVRQALQERLRTGKDDLLVMGSRGRGAVTASLLGSVSHYALNHSSIPVLIVHADDDAQPISLENSASSTASGSLQMPV